MALFKPLPVNFGDTFGSTLAAMLYPDDADKAKHWHALYLARRPLDEYRAAGHDFEDRWPAFLKALRSGNSDESETADRIYGGQLAADTIAVLWAMVCSDPKDASWSKAVATTSAHARKRELAVIDRTTPHRKPKPTSISYIRTQLRLFAPVLHLWLAWRLSDDQFPQEGQLFLDAYSMLFSLRDWGRTKTGEYRPDNAILDVQEFGPWPELESLMAKLGGSTQPRSSFVKVSGKN